jgi:hypothetical protein
MFSTMTEYRLRTMAAERGLTDDHAYSGSSDRHCGPAAEDLAQRACRCSTHMYTRQTRPKRKRCACDCGSPLGLEHGRGYDTARIPEALESKTTWRARRSGFASTLGTLRPQGGRRTLDGLVVVVSLRVQEGGCRRSSLGASTGRRCLTLKILKMG